MYLEEEVAITAVALGGVHATGQIIKAVVQVQQSLSILIRDMIHASLADNSFDVLPLTLPDQRQRTPATVQNSRLQLTPLRRRQGEEV